jgi:hypothetical protein
MRRTVFGILLLFNYLLIKGQTAAARSPANVVLQFVHVADGRSLHFDSSYTNAFGEPYTIKKFRYYISQLAFASNNPGTRTILFDTTFLIDESKPGTKQIALVVPQGNYDRITFILGVDSIKNVSGAQSGALDPLMDMFWTWNTGYVMAKLEGSSPVSKLPHHMIEYHIGGFAGKYKVLKSIDLNPPKGGAIKIQGARKQQVVIEADINAWFKGAHHISIAQYPACTSIGQLAQQFSDNYSQMFAIRSINTN